MVIFAVVGKKDCQKFRKLVESLNVYDGSYKCRTMDGERVGIPLREATVDKLVRCGNNPACYVLGGVVFCMVLDEGVQGKVRETVADRLQHGVERVMGERGLWLEQLKDEVPHSWEKYGDLVVFSTRKYFAHQHWDLAGDTLWDVVCAILRVKRIALRHHIQADAFRSPALRLVRGDCGWVEHRDNGILYCWDVTRSMFCAGNVSEKQRVARLDCTGQTVVDMFAGIGYFTLPFLVHAQAQCVHACEWNPHALRALRHNLKQNNVSERCVVHPGDCNQVCPVGVADRVCLGLLPSSRTSWLAACTTLKDLGGVLHIHECVPEQGEACAVCTTIITTLPEQGAMLIRQFFSCGSSQDCAFQMLSEDLLPHGVEGCMVSWKWAGWRRWALHVAHSVCEALPREGVPHWRVCVEGLHHVKSYAPHIDHLVLDLHCEPVTTG